MAAVFQSSDPHTRSLTHRAEKVFPSSSSSSSSSSHSCSWKHSDYTPALTISILSHLFCSLRHAVKGVLMYKLPVCFLSLHTFTPALHSSHYQLCSFLSLPRIQQVTHRFIKLCTWSFTSYFSPSFFTPPFLWLNFFLSFFFLLSFFLPCYHSIREN